MIVCGFSITSPQGNAPVLVLDCNKDFVTDGEQREKLMVKVEEFLCSLGLNSGYTAAESAVVDHEEDEVAAAHS